MKYLFHSEHPSGECTKSGLAASFVRDPLFYVFVLSAPFGVPDTDRT